MERCSYQSFIFFRAYASSPWQASKITYAGEITSHLLTIHLLSPYSLQAYVPPKDSYTSSNVAGKRPCKYLALFQVSLSTFLGLHLIAISLITWIQIPFFGFGWNVHFIISLIVPLFRYHEKRQTQVLDLPSEQHLLPYVPLSCPFLFIFILN